VDESCTETDDFAGAERRAGWHIARVEPEEQATVIRTAADAAALAEPLLTSVEGEKIVVLHLTRDRSVIAVVEYGGEAAHAELPLRQIMGEALRLGSEGLVVAHNHPSGDPEPSAEDLSATRELTATARSLAIALHDHLIFAGGEWRSLRQMGLL
jgi:DNA repair protein RadC